MVKIKKVKQMTKHMEQLKDKVIAIREGKIAPVFVRPTKVKEA